MAELARWCRAQSLSGLMTNAVIKAFVDLDSLRSCANDPGMVDEGLGRGDPGGLPAGAGGSSTARGGEGGGYYDH